ncbi:MAG: outer membrane protein assembly factor BamB [Candidatus Paceibacteria bacterium]|jgi:outer membrane protein assembly factor BamB
MSRSRHALHLTTLLAIGSPLMAQNDWPMWGHDETRNMVSNTKGLPAEFAPGDFKGATDDIDVTTAKNLKWVAKIGSQTYGNPTVSGGKVFVGSNNDSPRSQRFKGDRCVVYCFDESDGKFNWQLNIPKLGTGQVSDWDYVGLCCSPSVEGDRVYIVTNRCEVMCLDLNGLANGNDGPFQDEAQYQAGPGEKPIALDGTDADIIWVLDMMKECGVAPHNVTTSSVLIAGDQLWVTSANGVDYSHMEIPAPAAPSLILVDKRTGKLLAEEASGLSSRIFHSNWSSPAFLRTEETALGIFGGPDGICYAFTTTPKKGESGNDILEEAWRFDCNPASYREKDGKALQYTDRYGPSEIIATPITYNGMVYTAIGQDPEHGEGVGNLTCLDAAGKQVWSYDKINRSMSTCAAQDGLLFTADLSGFVYCLDAKTGEEYWIHDTMGHIWSSPLVADGKLYIGNEDGFMTVINATKEYDKKETLEIDMVSPIYSSVVAANGVLYVATHTHLFAFASTAE